MCQLSGTEVRTAHRAVFALGVSCLLEVLECQLWVEREVELVAPAELEASFRQGVVTDGSAWMSLRQVGGMGGYLVGDHTCAHVILVRQGEMLLRGDIAEHGGSEPSDLCATDGGSDMVVAWGDVGDKGTEGVEWSLMAMVELTLHVLLDFCNGT